jgi:excisionase family DNA binding protein
MTWLTTGEVARRLHVQPSTVRKWIESGHLPACKNPGPLGHYRVLEIHVNRLDLEYRANETNEAKEAMD